MTTPANGPTGPEDPWREIVLGLGGTEEQANAPAPEDPTPETGTSDETSTETSEMFGSHIRPLGPRDYIPPEEPDHFEPTEPPAITSSSPRMVLSWIGALGAPIALVLMMMLWPLSPWWLQWGLILTFLAGLVNLFLAIPTGRSRSQRHDDDDYGGGAKV